MPQPKKQGSSACKPSARKPAARKPAARKPAASRSGRAAPPKPATDAKSAAASGATPADERREDQLLAAAASLRDMLSKGVVITGDRLQEAVDEVVKRGRMTREDAEELVHNLVEIGRRQTQDALAEIEGIIGRSATQTRRMTRSRVKSVGAVARRAPGTDRALRTVDRVRRAAGLGPGLPDHRLRRPHDGAGQGAPRRPERRRAAQGPRPRAPQRQPQVGPGGDRQAAAVARHRAASGATYPGAHGVLHVHPPREGRRARSADRHARVRRQRGRPHGGLCRLRRRCDPRRPRARGHHEAQASVRRSAHAAGARAEPRADRAARRSPRRALAGAALRAPAGDQARAGAGRADADRPSRRLPARPDRARRRAVALPQQARVLVRHGR